MAGVTANFACYFLIGYIAKKKIRWMPSVIGYSIITALLLWVAYVYTDVIYVGIVAASYVIFVVFALLARKRLVHKWQSYNVSSVIGLLVGSGIIGLMVPVYFQYFAPNSTPITLGSGLAYFIWTFTTEIPFLLILGPPIISVIYRAFPSLSRKEEKREPQ